VVGKYKAHYLLSTILLLASIFARSLEPKILQIAVDVVLQPPGMTEQQQQQGTAIDRLITPFLPENPATTVTYALLILALLYLLISLIRSSTLFVSSAVKHFATHKTIKKLRNQTFAHLQHVPLPFYNTISKGELMQRCTGDIDTIKDFIDQQIITFLRLTATFLFSLFLMFDIHPMYALYTVSLSPLIAYLSIVFFKKEKNIWKQHEAEADKLNSMVQENLHSIRIVSAFNNQAYEIEKFDRQNIRKREMGIKQSRLHATFWPLIDFFVNLQLMMAIIFGGYFVFIQEITVGELMGFYAYVSMIAYPMRQLGKVLSNMGMANVAMSRISEILSQPLETSLPENEKLTSLTGHITFDKVCFNYTPKEPQVLQQVSFHIEAGEKVAIVGQTGSGKTTLIKLLLGLYRPVSGQIRLDHVPLDQYPLPFIRKKIGLTFQSAFLFSTTIKNNISYAVNNPHISQIEQAAVTAGMADISSRFEKGMDTMVGEKGVSLSGGQKQRLALARTLLTEPDIVILDDTTSAVDRLTESKILSELNTSLKNKTVLMITHRMSVMEKAHRILLMKNGLCVAFDTFDAIQKRPEFIEMMQEKSAPKMELYPEISPLK
jgi:ATP-binding cassette, subfamily B, bacterial